MGRRVANELMPKSCYDEGRLFGRVLLEWFALADGLSVILGFCSENIDSHGSSLIISLGDSDSSTAPGKANPANRYRSQPA